jgi:hypothetical protein
MIISENWPGATREMADGYMSLISVVGAIPSHREVTFEAPAREIMTYAAMDYSEAATGQELGLTKQEIISCLRPAYDQLHGKYGSNQFQKLPHLTYVGLNNRSIVYPDFSRLRPEITAVEGVVLLGLASRQAFYSLQRVIGSPSDGFKLDRAIDGLHEKFGTETNPGLVGRGFMFGFFGPSVTSLAERQ